MRPKTAAETELSWRQPDAPAMRSRSFSLLLRLAPVTLLPGLAHAAAINGVTGGSTLATALIIVIGGTLLLLFSNRRLKQKLKDEEHQRLSAETALTRKRNELRRHVDNRSHALHQLSFYDPLTDLPNRTLLYERLTHATLTYERDERAFGLLLIDLNRFKAINDTLGHYIGDSMLQEVGVRLQKTAGTDTIYYLGGDEFAIMQPISDDAVSPETLALRIHEALSRPFLAKGLPISIGASIGIADYPQHTRDADNLLRFAEIAMYCAKRQQSDFAVYDRSQRQDTKSNLVLAGELRQALDRDELLMHYQPKVDLARGEVVGLEALVRWHHPREGLMSPERFINLAEQTGLVRPLTLWVLNAVLRQCASWRNQGIEMPVAINLSVLNLQDPYLEQQFAELLDAWDLPPSVIEVEVTESAAIEDPERAQFMLGRLSRLGIPVALDDFGTGYSSMVHLKKLPINTIKIDKSFVRDMESDPDDAVIVGAIIDLAHNLGLDVVAEGVEDRACWERLIAMKCNVVQGFYISRPLDSRAVTHWLLQRSSDDEKISPKLCITSVA